MSPLECVLMLAGLGTFTTPVVLMLVHKTRQDISREIDKKVSSSRRD